MTDSNKYEQKTENIEKMIASISIILFGKNVLMFIVSISNYYDMMVLVNAHCNSYRNGI